jgi:uncharacterized membrane protein
MARQGVAVPSVPGFSLSLVLVVHYQYYCYYYYHYYYYYYYYYFLLLLLLYFCYYFYYYIILVIIIIIIIIVIIYRVDILNFDGTVVEANSHAAATRAPEKACAIDNVSKKAQEEILADKQRSESLSSSAVFSFSSSHNFSLALH